MNPGGDLKSQSGYLCADPDDRGDTFTEPVKFRCDRAL